MRKGKGGGISGEAGAGEVIGDKRDGFGCVSKEAPKVATPAAADEVALAAAAAVTTAAPMVDHIDMDANNDNDTNEGRSSSSGSFHPNSTSSSSTSSEHFSSSSIPSFEFDGSPFQVWQCVRKEAVSKLSSTVVAAARSLFKHSLVLFETAQLPYDALVEVSWGEYGGEWGGGLG
jgi:hypothetical protein